MKKDLWNPNQYEKFKAERAKPFWDLVGLIEPAHVHRAIDLGCGTGELTRELHLRLKLAHTLGIDSSAQMLAKAEKFIAPGLAFQANDIETFRPSEPLDLVFSNAALQWIPDHERVIPKILSWVRPGGQVAIQVPSNFDHPSHRIADEVARENFSEKNLETRDTPVLSVERYATLLYEGGFAEQRCRLEVYGHSMASGSDVVEWTKGTLLTFYQQRLTPSEFEQFLHMYRARLLAVIGEGPYFYPFKRILLWGKKSG